MNITHYIPEPSLGAIVRNIMVFEDTMPAGIYTQFPFYADGCPGLIYQYTADNKMLYNDSKKLPALFVYGQTVKPVVLKPSGSYKIVIYFFYPYVLKSLFGIQSGEITDSCLDLELYPVPGVSGITDALQNATDTGRQLAIINQYLLRLANLNEYGTERRIHYAVTHIAGHKGQASLKELRNTLNITERTFERNFEHHVGVSPKTFLRISQFRASLQQIHRNEYIKLSDVAYRNGYADQPHFIRSFKRFTGFSPFEYVKNMGSARYAGYEQ